MQTRLSVEEHDVAVNDMSLDDVTDLEAVRNSSPVAELEILLKPITPSCHIVRAGVNIASVSNGPLQHLDVVRCHAFRICQYLRNSLRHRHLVDTQVWVRRDDRTSREIHTFPRQIASETTLLPLKSLAEATNRLLTHLRGDAWQL